MRGHFCGGECDGSCNGDCTGECSGPRTPRANAPATAKGRATANARSDLSRQVRRAVEGAAMRSGRQSPPPPTREMQCELQSPRGHQRRNARRARSTPRPTSKAHRRHRKARGDTRKPILAAASSRADCTDMASASPATCKRSCRWGPTYPGVVGNAGAHAGLRLHRCLRGRRASARKRLSRSVFR